MTFNESLKQLLDTAPVLVKKVFETNNNGYIYTPVTGMENIREGEGNITVSGIAIVNNEYKRVIEDILNEFDANIRKFAEKFGYKVQNNVTYEQDKKYFRVIDGSYSKVCFRQAEQEYMLSNAENEDGYDFTFWVSPKFITHKMSDDGRMVMFEVKFAYMF